MRTLKVAIHGKFILVKALSFSLLMVISAPFYMMLGDSNALSNGLRSAMEMASELVEIGYITQSEFDEFEKSVFK